MRFTLAKKMKIKRSQILIVIALAVFLFIAWFTIGPMLTYERLLQAPETGMRLGYHSTLARQGPIGKHFARKYAIERTDRWPSYGHFFILYRRELWIGLSRSEMHKQFGVPDDVHDSVDVWAIGRKWAMKRGMEDESFTWEDALRVWTLHLAAEYDENGHVIRFGNPGTDTGYLRPIEESPYQTHFKMNFDVQELYENPPNEWQGLREPINQPTDRRMQ